jgi:hypothetical protein
MQAVANSLKNTPIHAETRRSLHQTLRSALRRRPIYPRVRPRSTSNPNAWTILAVTRLNARWYSNLYPVTR